MLQKNINETVLGSVQDPLVISSAGWVPKQLFCVISCPCRLVNAGTCGYRRQNAIVSSRFCLYRATAGGSKGLYAGATVGIVLGAIVGTAALIAGNYKCMHLMHCRAAQVAQLGIITGRWLTCFYVQLQ